MLSERLRNAVKLSRCRQYELAHAIHVHPGTLSAWVNGIYAPRRGDARVKKLADLMNVPECEAFATEPVDEAAVA